MGSRHPSWPWRHQRGGSAKRLIPQCIPSRQTGRATPASRNYPAVSGGERRDISSPPLQSGRYPGSRPNPDDPCAWPLPGSARAPSRAVPPTCMAKAGRPPPGPRVKSGRTPGPHRPFRQGSLSWECGWTDDRDLRLGDRGDPVRGRTRGRTNPREGRFESWACGQVRCSRATGVCAPRRRCTALPCQRSCRRMATDRRPPRLKSVPLAGLPRRPASFRQCIAAAPDSACCCRSVGWPTLPAIQQGLPRCPAWTADALRREVQLPYSLSDRILLAQRTTSQGTFVTSSRRATTITFYVSFSEPKEPNRESLVIPALRGGGLVCFRDSFTDR